MPHSTIESPRNLPRGQARIRAEVTLFAFACAFVFLAYSLPSVIASNVAKNWPVVEGEVLHSTAVGTAQPVALYRYTVEFHKFVSERVRFEPAGAPLQSRLLPTQIDNVPESKVLVHYDPNRPDQSVLFTEVRPDAWMCLVIGIAALAIGIAGLTAWRRDVADPDYAFAVPRAAAHGAG